ncbi:MAG: AbgT family transporter, partial [Spirochaetaceae bacterium]|nr:AbgT family transporter [Spirochaetaceae bacterium]
MSELKKSSVKIGARAFVLAGSILMILIIVSGILTRTLPAGEYERIERDGRTSVIQGSFEYLSEEEAASVRDSQPIWRWFTAPIEVFWGENALSVAVIGAFLFFVGGSFTIVESVGLMESILVRAVDRFWNRKYLLMALVIGVIMVLSSFVGLYEGLLPVVIFIVPLAITLGWDSLTGLGMSLLAMGFGFAAAVTNPFTVQVPQKLAELPVNSGAWLRLPFLVLAYIVAFGVTALYAKRVEKDRTKSLCYKADADLRSQYEKDKVLAGREAAMAPSMGRAITWFGTAMGFGVVLMLGASTLTATGIWPGASDLSFPLLALVFLAAGLGAGIFAGLKGRKLAKVFFGGMLNILPGLFLIVMAMAVPHIMTRGKVMDTILFRAGEMIRGSGTYPAVVLIYLVTLFMNFFVSSASAKAFLMMPILIPLAEMVGVTRQTTVFAFSLGDGFSNILYPTNALLLIGLSFTKVGWGTWVRWSIKAQAVMAVLALLFLGI